MIDLRNFLPRDTRTIELASGISLLAYALFMMAEYSVIREHLRLVDHLGMLGVERVEVWILLCALFGSLQIYAIVSTTHLAIIRAVCAWVGGYFWIWEASSYDVILSIGVDNKLHVDGILSWVIGMGNFFAFIMQVSFLRAKWKR